MIYSVLETQLLVSTQFWVNLIYVKNYLFIPNMLGKILIYFVLVVFLSRFTIVSSLDVFLLFANIGFLAVLIFLFPWKQFDEWEVKHG